VKFLSKIGAGLAATHRYLSEGLQSLFTGQSQLLDAQFLDRMEELLIGADLGVEVTGRFLTGLQSAMDHREVTDLASVKRRLSTYIVTVLEKACPAPTAQVLPAVSLFVGVNGVGKTTTVGKRAQQLRNSGYSVLLAAADTFRSGAIEQLKIWGNRTDAEVICHQPGGDPAAVAHDAIAAGVARHIDHVLIDTAGRLQTRHNLMAELEKMHRVISKGIGGRAYDRVLVLDATTGQNALSQARIFHQAIEVTSIMLTKIDSTAKGGIIVPVVEALSRPVTHIGVGEGVEDLIPFDARQFAEALLGEAA